MFLWFLEWCRNLVYISLFNLWLGLKFPEKGLPYSWVSTMLVPQSLISHPEYGLILLLNFHKIFLSRLGTYLDLVLNWSLSAQSIIYANYDLLSCQLHYLFNQVYLPDDLIKLYSFHCYWSQTYLRIYPVCLLSSNFSNTFLALSVIIYIFWFWW